MIIHKVSSLFWTPLINISSLLFSLTFQVWQWKFLSAPSSWFWQILGGAEYPLHCFRARHRAAESPLCERGQMSQTTTLIPSPWTQLLPKTPRVLLHCAYFVFHIKYKPKKPGKLFLILNFDFLVLQSELDRIELWFVFLDKSGLSLGQTTFSTRVYVDFVIVLVVENRLKEQQWENSNTSGERTVTHLEKEELHIWRKRSTQEKLPSVTQEREHGPGPDSFQGMICLVFNEHL